MAQRRRALGYTQEALAEFLGVERSTVVRWERGETTLQPYLQPKLARALDITHEELVRYLTDAVSTNQGDKITAGCRPEVTEALILSASVLGASNVDADYIQAIREHSQHLVALDSRYGGDDALPLAIRVFRAAHGKLESVSLGSSLRRDLEAATGEAGEVAAWVAYDADQQSVSRQIIQEALLMSQLAGDRDMALFELNHLAMQSLYLHRPRAAMRIAGEVIDAGKLTSRVAALFAIRRGRAFAQYGDRKQAFDTLDKARSALNSSITAKDPRWTWWIDEAELTWHRAMAHGDLGEWRAAVPLFKEAAARRASPPGRASYNDAVHFLDSLVRVEAWPESEQTLINDVLPQVTEIGSMRTTNLLLRIIERIQKSRKTAPSTLTDAAADLRRFLEPDPRS